MQSSDVKQSKCVCTQSSSNTKEWCIKCEKQYKLNRCLCKPIKKLYLLFDFKCNECENNLMDIVQFIYNKCLHTLMDDGEFICHRCHFHQAFDSDFICIRCQDEENGIEEEYL